MIHFTVIHLVFFYLCIEFKKLVICLSESTFKRSYLLDRRKMNGETLSEADMENLRRRMAEARIFDVTEV